MRPMPNTVVVAGAILLAWAAAGGADKDAKPAEAGFEYQGLVPRQDVEAGERQASEAAALSGLSSEQRAAALNNRAFWRFFQARYDEALTDLDEAINLDGQSAYYANRGIMRRMLGDWDKARADYDKALKIDPNNAYAHNNLGWLTLREAQKLAPGKERSEKVQQAQKHFRNAIDCQTDDKLSQPLAQVNLAAACLADGELEAARQSLTAARGAPKVFPWAQQCALLNQGELARCDGDWQQALDAYQKAYERGRARYLPPPSSKLEKAPWDEADENPWILQRLGAAQLVLGRYDEAQKNLSTAAEKFGPQRVAGRYASLLAALANAHRNNRKAIYVERSEGKPKRWVDAVELYLAGRLSERALASAARDDDPKARQGKECEMAYYVGQKKLLEGKAQEARESFRQCVRLSEPRRLERTMAAHELQDKAKTD
ncbi:MAG TPA: tetratricopeptide repeat protein [Phycisphaerae bacterium]|nr:tetratricopeptide repeat protein [Phycisphaerae bacterium]